MQKKYRQFLAEAYIEYIKGLKEDKALNLKWQDNLIVWPVTLSTAAIALIISTFDKGLFRPHIYKYCIALFVLTILFSLCARLFNYWAIILYQKMEAEFMFLSLREKIPIDIQPLKGTETAEAIYIMMQESFQIHNPLIIDRYPLLNEDQRKIADASARKYYDDYIEFSQLEFEDAVKTFDRVMIDSFGLKENYFDKRRSKKKQNTRTKKIKGDIYRFIVNSFLLLSIVSFAISSVLLVHDFMTNL